MKKLYFSRVIILFFLSTSLLIRPCSYAQAPDFLWAKSAGGSSTNVAYSVTSDANGATYVAGNFGSPTITFGSTTLTNAGVSDMFLAKYDAFGNVFWAKSAGGTSGEYGKGVSIDASGNVYVIGWFDSPSITFGSTTLTSVGGSDIFLVKYDISGNVLWAKSAGGTSGDGAYSVTADANGSCYVAGSFNSSSIVFGSTTLTNGGISDIFLAKYDANGNVLWAKNAGGTSSDYANSVSIDANGNILITGFFASSTITFGSNTFTNAGSDDFFIVKYDENGNVLWAKSAGGSASDVGNSVSTDDSGNLIVTGYFNSPSIIFDSTTLTNNGTNTNDIFIVKYDPNGNAIWAKHAGANSVDVATSGCIDANGNSLIAGYFASPTLIFDSTTLVNSNAGNYEIFLAYYDSLGNVLWAKSAGGSSDDFARSVSFDGSGNSYIVGYFGSTLIIFGSDTLVKLGGSDIFIAKLAAPPLWASISQNNVSCNGGSDGSATVTATGGTKPYSYVWSNGDTISSINFLPSSIYIVTITDSLGNIKIDSVTIIEPPFVATYTDTTAKILFDSRNCRQYPIEKISDRWWMTENLDYLPSVVGYGTGSETVPYYYVYGYNGTDVSTAKAQINYNTFGVLYNWVAAMNGATSSDSIPSGVQGVCPTGWHLPSDAEWKDFEIGLGMSQADANATGYRGTNEGGQLKETGNSHWLSPNLGATNSSGFSALPGGYCSPGSSFFDLGGFGHWWSSLESSSTTAWDRHLHYTEARLARSTYTKAFGYSIRCVQDFLLPLTVSITNVLNVSCNGSSDGTATVTTSGGATPYIFLWSTGGPTQTITALSAGIYFITVTDSDSYTAIDSVTITEPPLIQNSIIAAICSTDSIFLQGNYQTIAGNYYDTLTALNGCDSVIATTLTINPSTNQPINQTICGGDSIFLQGSFQNTAGTYYDTLSSVNGCDSIITTTITLLAKPTISVDTAINVTCFGNANGIIDFNVTGGSTPYNNIQWYNGIGTILSAYSGLTIANSLNGDTYTIFVTDGAGCVSSISQAILEPGQLILSVSSTDASCYGCSDGTATTNVSGGNSPFTYLWSDGQTSQTATGLEAGTYVITVTDVASCTSTATATISQPACTLNVTISSTNVSCNGGSNGTATVTPSGGSTPYFYQWSNGQTTQTSISLTAGNYSVTTTDPNSCNAISTATISQPAILTATATSTSATCGISNGTATSSATGGTSPYNYQWSSGEITAIVDSLPAGIYMVTVTDSNSCSNFTLVMINNIGSPVISVISVTNVSCNGGNNGAIDISVSGGTTPYSYSWSNGATTQDINNLSMSPYEIIVTGANGCSAAQSIFVSQPAALAASTSATEASCGNADGSVTATANGGTSPYTYLWSNGSTTPQISNLAAQIYTVTITDNTGCTTTASAAIGNTGGATVQVDSIIPAGCGGAGAIYVSVSGGTTPYTYSWTNGATTQNLTNAAVGNYGLIVIDSNGCTGAISAVIPAQQLLPDQICLITVDTVTGTNKLVWQKAFGMGISSYKIYKETTIAGIYQLAGTVPFVNLSVFTDSVANPLIRSWRYKLTSVDSCGNESVLSAEHKTIHLTVNQGLGNTYNLIWDHYQGFAFGTYYIWRYKQNTGWVLRDSLPSNLTSWTDYTPPTPFSLRYLIEIIHPDGCTATKSVENHNSSRSNKTYPIAPPAPNLSATATSNDENGTCNGNATITVSGGVSPYSFLWSTNDTIASIDSLCTGTYSCTVTDTDGDTITTSVVILLTNISKTGEKEISLKVFPNPSKGIFTLNVSDNGQQLSVLIFNLLGEIIYQSKFPTLKSTMEIDISKNDSGIYYLQIATEDGNSFPMKIIFY